MSEAVAISVIMSTRNRARYLPDALSTLAAQQCDVPFEVIVIDNGSTDSTPRSEEHTSELQSRLHLVCRLLLEKKKKKKKTDDAVSNETDNRRTLCVIT